MIICLGDSDIYEQKGNNILKKIQREETKVIRTDIWVSVDDKEFTSEADCRAWETSYKGTMEASWKLINKVEVSDCGLGLPWSSDDHECYIIKPKNLDEIVLINAYITSSTCNKGLLTAEHINQTLVLNFGYDHDYCDVYVLADHIKNVLDYVNKVELELKEAE